MNKLDVESSILSQYVNDVKSKPLKIRLNSGSIYRGKFIKQNQKDFNSKRNKWIFTIDYLEIMIDGNDIETFSHLNTNNRNKPNTK